MVGFGSVLDSLNVDRLLIEVFSYTTVYGWNLQKDKIMSLIPFPTDDHVSMESNGT